MSLSPTMAEVGQALMHLRHRPQKSSFRGASYIHVCIENHDRQHHPGAKLMGGEATILGDNAQAFARAAHLLHHRVGIDGAVVLT